VIADPKIAITASPVNFSRVPPCSAMASSDRVATEHRAHVLRIGALTKGGRAGDVREEDRDDAALLGHARILRNAGSDERCPVCDAS